MMNKEKVMQAVYEVADLQSICDKDIREKAINKVQKELESKPVMPKIFDEWHEEELELCSCCEEEIDDLINLSTEPYMPDRDSNSTYQLFEWINQIDQDDIKANISRFLKCIDAILYGYEVEK